MRPSRTQADRPTTCILHPIQRFSACESAHFGAIGDRKGPGRNVSCMIHKAPCIIMSGQQMKPAGAN